MSQIKIPKHPLSSISLMHYIKLVGRTLLLVLAAVIYIINRVNNTGSLFGGAEHNYAILFVIWAIFVVEMILRFFPSRFESTGCQKQFKNTFKPTNIAKPELQPNSVTILVAVVWLALNAVFGILYYSHVIDAGILILISLTFSVCDMICILFFCPFQTWFMKNKCCTSCRIYNWDFAMMFTPLVFIKNPFALSIFLCAVALLIRWEVAVYRHPERFSEKTNACLSCANCNEKLCYHKRQLRHFLVTNKDKVQLKGNALMNSIIKNETKKKAY